MGKGIKVLIGLLVVAAVGLAGFAGYQAIQAAQTSADSSQDSSDGVKGVLGRLPTPENKADVLDNLDVAFQKNPSSVAWLEVPGTNINNVVVQGDDNDYYLRRNEDGNHDAYGCYFLDYECTLGKREELAQNAVIYGHSEMTDDPDGKRFAQLFRFIDPDFAGKHPYIYLTTPEERYTYEIFSVFYTDVSFDYIRVNLSDAEKLALAQKAEDLSLYDYGYALSETDRLLTLSTCSIRYGEDGNQRFVVMGRLLPADTVEKETVTLQVRQTK